MNVGIKDYYAFGHGASAPYIGERLKPSRPKKKIISLALGGKEWVIIFEWNMDYYDVLNLKKDRINIILLNY